MPVVHGLRSTGGGGGVLAAGFRWQCLRLSMILWCLASGRRGCWPPGDHRRCSEPLRVLAAGVSLNVGPGPLVPVPRSPGGGVTALCLDVSINTLPESILID